MTTPAANPGPPSLGHTGMFTPAMRQAAVATSAPPAASQRTVAIAQSQASLTSRLNQAATNLITSNMLKRPPIPPSAQPRVGGVDILGSWTGRGARGLGQEPKGPNCRRIFNTSDHLKACNAMAPVDQACKAGVVDEDLHFSLSSEPNGNKVSLCQTEIEKLVLECGMNPVFKTSTSLRRMVQQSTCCSSQESCQKRT
jgi:hypothetical protein